ncbi:hypothetical protein WH52_00715 [Tenacibaculum holothuriorum]|uniref:Prenyltransferase n=1 Tax=Tenacibaculum holothuriorum TaxID=1635173 RepID=A0A1Y2PHM9_9FLAO|nr:UbiA family prenyltransferase [Tenacibaculum holothuriorum]OSY89209.1 hypothetical protein WH52_00715 [Tenacibaculum holothuriorum]
MFDSFLSIIKWKKLVHIVVVQFLFKYCFLYGYGFETKLTFVDLGVLSLSTITILASGYLAGYYLRYKSNKHLVFSSKDALALSVIFGVTGVALGIYLSVFIGKPYYSIIQFISLFGAILYFKLVRKKTFFNNIMEGVLKVLCVLIVWWFDYPIELNAAQANTFFYLQLITIFYVTYSFLGNILREILIDIININNDYIKKHKTLPIVLGRKRAKNIILTVSIFILFATVAFALLVVKDKFILGVIFLFGTVPQLWFIKRLMGVNTSIEYQKFMKVSNLVYILAVVSIPIIAIYFKYVI